MAFRKFEFETVWVLVEFETVWRTKTVWQIYRLWHHIKTNGSIKSGVVQTYASNVNITSMAEADTDIDDIMHSEHFHKIS
jgi:hypothetical protein